MSRFMIIPRIDKLDESLALAHEYGFGFEFNDFYSPKVLDDTELTESIIEKYKAAGFPTTALPTATFLTCWCSARINTSGRYPESALSRALKPL